MKSISSAIIVLCGTAMVITACALPAATEGRETLWKFGCAVGALGLFGWALTMGSRPPRDNGRPDHNKK